MKAEYNACYRWLRLNAAESVELPASREALPYAFVCALHSFSARDAMFTGWIIPIHRFWWNFRRSHPSLSIREVVE
jgi:hypothetical protein